MVDYVMLQHRVQLIRHKMYVIADIASLAGANQVNEKYYKEQFEVQLYTPSADSSLPPEYQKPSDEKYACEMAKEFIDKNDFNVGGLAWIDNPTFNSSDINCEVDNNIGQFQASVKITLNKTVSPYFIKNFKPSLGDAQISTSAKSVVGTKE